MLKTTLLIYAFLSDLFFPPAFNHADILSLITWTVKTIRDSVNSLNAVQLHVNIQICAFYLF